MLYATIVEETSLKGMIAKAAASGRKSLSEIESKQLLREIGIEVAMPELAHTADEAVATATRCGFPAVLKVLAGEVSHKSEVGGVVLNLRSAREVEDAFQRIRDNLAEKSPQAHFEGVAVQPMAAPGVELIAGITRDDRYG
ncbi:MAG: acetate--CoA ligase family protein, partial [Candidatus Binataceae bacterium]